MEDSIRESAICPKRGHPKAHGQLVCHTCRGECDCGAKLEPGEYADASLVDG
jgi:hypothetical protein